MFHLDPTVFTTYLVVVLAVAALGVALSLAVAVRAALGSRRVRLASGESFVHYYGHVALGH
jgi:hypothetical protein